MLSILGFLIATLTLVTVHEWGHFYTARLLGVKVLTFSVGFGPVILKRQRRGVDYQISMVPLGGYVRFIDDEADADCFQHQPAWKRLLIVLAGPAINVVLAFLLFLVLSTQSTYELKPWVRVAGEVNAEHAENAINAGTIAALKSHGKGLIQQVDGKPVQHWQEVQLGVIRASLSEKQSIIIQLRIDGQLYPFTVATAQLDTVVKAGSSVLVLIGVELYLPPVAAVIDRVLPDSPALKAGLQTGDHIVQIGEQTIERWHQVSDWVRVHPDSSVAIHIKRAGDYMVLPTFTGSRQIGKGDAATTIGFLGIGAKQNFEDSRYWYQHQQGVWYLLQSSMLQMWRIVELSISGIQKKIIKEGDISQLSGPVGIAQMAGDTLESGWQSFVGFLALLSLSIAIFNILPVPLLDGGQALMIMCEMLIGRRLPKMVVNSVNTVGVVMIIGLMALALTSDFMRVF